MFRTERLGKKVRARRDIGAYAYNCREDQEGYILDREQMLNVFKIWRSARLVRDAYARECIGRIARCLLSEQYCVESDKKFFKEHGFDLEVLAERG